MVVLKNLLVIVMVLFMVISCDDSDASQNGEDADRVLQDGDAQSDVDEIVEDSEAHSDEDAVDDAFSQIMCDAFEGTERKITGQAAFKDFGAAHAYPNLPMKIALIKNADNYFHFDPNKNGVYVISLNKKSLFSKAYNVDEEELVVSGGAPNAKCTDTLIEQWEITVNQHGVLSDPGVVVKLVATEEEDVTVIIKYKSE
ncbi:hypothetical protein KAH37_09750 [bacterium]|nr:hypothetical protein [bacterium]